MRCEICSTLLGKDIRPGERREGFLCNKCRHWVYKQRCDYYEKDNPEELGGGSFVVSDAFFTTLEDLQDLNFSYGDESYE